MKQVLLSDMVPTEILQEIQDAFANYTGMASLISDANGTPITRPSNFTHFCMDLTRQSKLGGKNCQECGRKAALEALRSGKVAVYDCHAGLTDYAAPIILNGEFIGSFTGGQVRTSETDEQAQQAFRDKAAEYDIDPDEYISAAKATNILPRQRVEKSADFLGRIANIVSRIAYERFQLLEQMKNLETAAKIRKDRLQVFSQGLQDDMNYINTYIEDAAKTNDSLKPFLSDINGRFYRTNEEIREIVIDMELEQEDFSLNETAYDIRWILERKNNELMKEAARHNRSITMKVDDDVPRIMIGDPARIGGIIERAVGRCLEFSGKEPVEIQISTKKETYSVNLQIKIIDAGFTIPEEELKKIGNVMGTADRIAVTDEVELYDSFAIMGFVVRAMNGRMGLSSEPEGGVTFTITIPQLVG